MIGVIKCVLLSEEIERRCEMVFGIVCDIDVVWKVMLVVFECGVGVVRECFL